MTKIYEIITPSVVAEVEMTFNTSDETTETRKLKFTKLKLKSISDLALNGIDVYKLFGEDIPFSESVSRLMKVMFSVMTKETRDEFNGDIDLFLDCLSVGDIEKFQEAFYKVMEISLPKSESDQDQ